MKKPRFILAVAVAALNLVAAPVAAQQETETAPEAVTAESEPVVIGHAITIRSSILDEQRRLLIGLPEGYHGSSLSYPVLYLLDGEVHFEHVAGVVRFLARIARVPPMIVVGVANAEWGNARVRDMTPPAEITTQTIEAPTGDSFTISLPPPPPRAETFLRFLSDELIPEVERRYRTASFRTLVGHSAAGRFAVDVLLSRPELFDAIVAVSPSLWWDDRALVRRAAREPLPDFVEYGPHFAYVAAGANEGESMVGPVADLANVIEVKNPEGLRWWSAIVPGGSHNQMTHEAIYDGLATIFSEYALSENLMQFADVERLRTHFADARVIYGYDVQPPPAPLLNSLGSFRLGLLGRPDLAKGIFDWSVELHPESPWAHDGLADALQAQGDLDAALGHRREAVRLAEAQDEPGLERLVEKLRELEEQFQGGE